MCGEWLNASYNLHPLFCLLGSELLSTSSLLADVHVRNNNIGYYFRLLGGPRVLHVVQICRSLLVEVWNLGYYFCLSGGPRVGPGWLGGLLPRCGPDCGISKSVLATCCKLLHMFCMMFYLVAFSEVWTQLCCQSIGTCNKLAGTVHFLPMFGMSFCLIGFSEVWSGLWY